MRQQFKYISRRSSHRRLCHHHPYPRHYKCSFRLSGASDKNAHLLGHDGVYSPPPPTQCCDSIDQPVATASDMALFNATHDPLGHSSQHCNRGKGAATPGSFHRCDGRFYRSHHNQYRHFVNFRQVSQPEVGLGKRRLRSDSMRHRVMSKYP